MAKQLGDNLHAVELEDLRQYLRSDLNEDAKRPLLYPLFRKLFKDKFKIESNAYGADVYVEGRLIVEAKTEAKQWDEGFFQALHYRKKYGLTYNTIIVIAHKFIAIWKLHKLPESATILAHKADPTLAPNAIGKVNAKKATKADKNEIRNAAQYWIDPHMLDGDPFAGARNLTTESFEILKILKNLDSDRVQVNGRNFISAIERMKPFFEHPIDAVHAFYSFVAYWDITSKLTERPNDFVCVTGFNGNKSSEDLKIRPRDIADFRKFIETQYIFTNEGSGITVDDYFSRFDEVLAEIDPDYVKQHGIFFTDSNLSKFALWYAKKHFPDNIDDNYIVFDPAGGSGNLVSSWRGKIKHKIVSELQPDLLRTIERRMKVDPYHVDMGFTIVPKTSEGKGLNFLDRSGGEYLDQIKHEVAQKNIKLDKPLAFLLNPPYKNTDENQAAREGVEAHYTIHPSILELTGEDAGKERYLAFLGQILNICKAQVADYHQLHPIVMVFTPTSWLLPRPTFVPFRKAWDSYFEYRSGFIINAKEFFSVDGSWPLAFTIWQFRGDAIENIENRIRALDLTTLKKNDLRVNWNFDDKELNQQIELITGSFKEIELNNSKGEIRNLLPFINRAKRTRGLDGELEIENIRQPRFDFSTAKNAKEYDKLVSGFPLKDTDRHYKLKRKCGEPNGNYIGFMDDLTPVRLKQEPCNRFSNQPDRIWFRLDSDVKGMNKSQCLAGPTDNRSYCAYDLSSAKATLSWFSITKALNAQYPLWANQFDLWSPKILKEKEALWVSNCFALVLSENRCAVTKFEKDNPVEGAPEVFVDNPLCPTNAESFWSTTLQPYINQAGKIGSAGLLIKEVTELYKDFNMRHTKGQFIQNVGLEKEPYFKYFSYPDFLTPHSGLIQIKKFADFENDLPLQQRFERITALTKEVKEKLYNMLVNEFKYFE